MPLQMDCLESKNIGVAFIQEPWINDLVATMATFEIDNNPREVVLTSAYLLMKFPHLKESLGILQNKTKGRCDANYHHEI